MSLIFLAAVLAGQGAPAVQPQQPAAKKKQVCEYIEVTGSRSKRRVCRNEEGELDLGPGVSNSAYAKSRIEGSGTGSSSPSAPQ